MLAAGSRSGRLDGVPGDVAPPVRPVEGSDRPAPGPDGVATPPSHGAGLVHGASCYLVPRDDGEIVVGATVEEQGFDLDVTAGGCADLLERRPADRAGPRRVPRGRGGPGPAARLARQRPDHRRRPRLAGLLVATGHYRNGVLLTPVTADLVAGLLVADGRRVPRAGSRPFAPDRSVAGDHRREAAG